MYYRMTVRIQIFLCCITDIDFCKLKDVPCRNGGTCVDGLFDYTCVCPLTRTGDHCETGKHDIRQYQISVIVF